MVINSFLYVFTFFVRISFKLFSLADIRKGKKGVKVRKRRTPCVIKQV